MSWEPLLLSFRVAILATLLAGLLGVALAWLLARRRFFGAELLDALFTAPMVLPPTVLGYYVLTALGRESALGRAFEAVTGSSIVFSKTGLVVAATLADEAARSQAEVGLGLVTERMAALPGVTNQPAMLNRALDHYLNVVFAATERTHPDWVKKAGVEALRLTESLGAWPQMAKLCDLLAEALPSERAWLARKKARAEEQIQLNGN